MKALLYFVVISSNTLTNIGRRQFIVVFPHRRRLHCHSLWTYKPLPSALYLMYLIPLFQARIVLPPHFRVNFDHIHGGSHGSLSSFIVSSASSKKLCWSVLTLSISAFNNISRATEDFSARYPLASFPHYLCTSAVL